MCQNACLYLALKSNHFRHRKFPHIVFAKLFSIYVLELSQIVVKLTVIVGIGVCTRLLLGCIVRFLIHLLVKTDWYNSQLCHIEYVWGAVVF